MNVSVLVWGGEMRGMRAGTKKSQGARCSAHLVS